MSKVNIIKHYEDVLGIKHPDNGGDRNKWVSGMHKHITQKHWDTCPICQAYKKQSIEAIGGLMNSKAWQKGVGETLGQKGRLCQTLADEILKLAFPSRSPYRVFSQTHDGRRMERDLSFNRKSMVWRWNCISASRLSRSYDSP